ncbi:MAG: TetR family transcriptional regulator [Dehalococcoidia bacterium]
MTARKGPLQQLRAERTRHRLIEAARGVFAVLGYQGATVDDIAQAAEVSKGAFYFHFESKEEALLLLIDGWGRARTQRLADASRRSSGLGGAVEALGSSGQDARLFVEFVAQAERSASVRAALTQAYDAWREQLTALFDSSTAGALLALCDGLAVQDALGVSTPASAQAALDLLAGRQRPLRATG